MRIGWVAAAGCLVAPTGCTTGGFGALSELPHQYTAALDRHGQRTAVLDVVSGAGTVSVAAAPLGGQPLRHRRPGGRVIDHGRHLPARLPLIRCPRLLSHLPRRLWQRDL
jgi:hypothetical protein